jgi:hypothetical protein
MYVVREKSQLSIRVQRSETNFNNRTVMPQDRNARLSDIGRSDDAPMSKWLHNIRLWVVGGEKNELEIRKRCDLFPLSLTVQSRGKII